MDKCRTQPLHTFLIFIVCASTSLWGPEASRAQTSSAQPRQILVGQNTDPVEDARIRGQAQRATLDQFNVYWDFRFRDRQPGSGIDFMHLVTDDSAKFYKPNHYDHGNGVVAADVDGDDLSCECSRDALDEQVPDEQPGSCSDRWDGPDEATDSALREGERLMHRLEWVLGRADRVGATTEASLAQFTAVEKHLTAG